VFDLIDDELNGLILRIEVVLGVAVGRVEVNVIHREAEEMREGRNTRERRL
jgi:hypothetical protein